MSNAAANGQHARTKIVATIGPACREEPQLAELVEAGVNVFRLNMAHADLDHHAETVRRVRAVSTKLGVPIGLLVDLAGPKIRVGEIPGGQMDCHAGAGIRFVRGSSTQAANELTCTYAPLVDELSGGDRVMLADGTISLVVEEKQTSSILCRVVQPGRLRSRQGLNLPGVKLSVPAMSSTDWAHAAWAAKMGIDFVGLSFVRSPVEVRALKEYLRSHDSQALVIAKIEKQEALDHLEEIVEAADGVMVARGDLGVEIDIARMAVVQKQIVAACNNLQRPVIIATQMLDSMQHSSQPTRAEATDVGNAILDGCDACMLSGETAMGEYPVAAVKMMHRIAAGDRVVVQRAAAGPATCPAGLVVAGGSPRIEADHLGRGARCRPNRRAVGRAASGRRHAQRSGGAGVLEVAKLGADRWNQRRRDDAPANVPLLGRHARGRQPGR